MVSEISCRFYSVLVQFPRVSESIMVAAVCLQAEKKYIIENTRFNIISCMHHTSFFFLKRSLENRLRLLKNVHFILLLQSSLEAKHSFCQKQLLCINIKHSLMKAEVVLGKH